MPDDAPRPLIFISYSHEDDEAKDFVASHIGVLEQIGDVERWDDSRIGLGDTWSKEIDDKLQRCWVAILLISKDFLDSEFCMQKEVPVLLERRRSAGMMIAPILLADCAWDLVPWLEAIQMLPSRGAPLLTLDEHGQNKEMTAVVRRIAKHVRDRKERGEDTAGDALERPEVKHDTPYPTPLAIDLTRLPKTAVDVVGRDEELRFLNSAIEGSQCNVVSLRAWGGVGKSTLVRKWCEYLAADNFRGANRVFAWSFYSQGTNQRVTSADAFIDEALRFFGERKAVPGSPWARGERLAALVGKEKALLILDGMEPLQDEHQGIKDPALARLVECLAAENAGLCVITTREPVKELLDFDETTEEVDLEYLSKEAGRALLRLKDLDASDDLLERASDAFGNHALALNLLASYLTHFAGGDVSQAFEIDDLPDVSIDDGKHPRRVMAAFAKKFGEGPELDLLHVMGLFDRPATGDSVAALRKPPALPGLTDHLVRENGGMLATWWRRAFGRDEAPSSDAIWDKLLAYLRDLGLLAAESHYAPDDLDAHPLVREHFGARLRERRPDAWTAGHARLYEHLKASAEHQPDTLAEMAPLFQAVHHGCQAGRRQEVYHDIYRARIVRKNEAYLVHKLGAFGADLGLMASFFDPPFDSPATDLAERTRAWLLNQVAHNLRALGRLGEAVAPMRAVLERDVEEQSWKEAAISASNLSELQIALGEVGAAVDSGEAGVKHADRSGDAFQRMGKRTTLADARHQAGDRAAAHQLFEEAEEIQAEFQPIYPKLYGLQGYRYCDLLLTLGQAEAVRERALKFFEWRVPSDSLLDIALDHLSLGRVALALGDRDEARNQLDQAVDGLREAGQIDYLSRGLLARAAFFREAQEHTESRRDLDKVLRIAPRSGMRLDECDAHLEYARLILAEGGSQADARASLDKAEALVRETGYKRRNEEIAELREALGR
ncbi:MAG: TIR domain-containing protein [Pseudomonadota bacterium]